MNEEISEAEKIGQFILDNLEKLMSGEHQGNAVICPITTENGGYCRITIDMPTDIGLRCGFKPPPTYTWVPAEQAYVRDDFVYKMKKKDKKE